MEISKRCDKTIVLVDRDVFKTKLMYKMSKILYMRLTLDILGNSVSWGKLPKDLIMD